MAPKKTITAASLVHDGQPIATQVVAKDFAWRRDSTGSETQTLYFQLENGCLGFVQLAWAYIALTTTIETNAMFYAPGQPCVFETHNGHHLKVHKKSQEFECKGLGMAWNDDYTQLTVKYTAGRERNPKGVSASFVFDRKSDGYKIGDGKTHIGEGTVSHYFYPAGKITAKGEIDGVKFESKGAGMFIHAHAANIMPYNVGSEWNMVYFIGHREDTPEDQRSSDNATTFHVLQYETPPSSGSVNCANSGLTESNQLKAVMWDTVVNHFDKEKDPNGSGYELPQRLVFTSNGKTVDGKKVKVTYEAKPTQRLHDIDILHEMPYVIRRLVQALITKPFVFERYEDKAKITVEVEGEKPYNVHGVTFQELTLMK
ncbi:putative cell survival pathways protein [Coemansia spiralis]|uniref:Cell survival pathways protein n=2 Tax=Coemansia TaxID=4863 RepID=A0A9W8G582_9FUNG|nr:oxidative stress survival, Svf1-like protein [Coemansia spiralis]KAJ1988920.1 putative cell survival pathways protein [Coemansia umbellata]KAJ2620021.1 putative cell survival pathways protein [Coemansia sp. RSA 1358]KAJ2672505.1 putative cell survival pathways protein [Coemansia spiralis]